MTNLFYLDNFRTRPISRLSQDQLVLTDLPNNLLNMKKTFWILAPLILIIGIVLLVIALTNNSPDNPFKEYRLIIGLGLLCATGFTRIAYKKLYK